MQNCGRVWAETGSVSADDLSKERGNVCLCEQQERRNRKCKQCYISDVLIIDVQQFDQLFSVPHYIPKTKLLLGLFNQIVTHDLYCIQMLKCCYVIHTSSKVKMTCGL